MKLKPRHEILAVLFFRCLQLRRVLPPIQASGLRVLQDKQDDEPIFDRDNICVFVGRYSEDALRQVRLNLTSVEYRPVAGSADYSLI